MEIKKVVLAYSGGLDTSVILHWLKATYKCEVIAFCADVGQGGEELKGVSEKALATGASKVYVDDLREEFVRGYIFPTVRAGAIYEHKYLLGTSFARPLIAKRQVEIAHLEGADAVSHGCTGKGNDQVRFELTYKALDPRLKIVAPWREWSLRGRADEIEYANQYQIPVEVKLGKLYSRDRNIWHLSHEGGPLEDPWWEPDEDLFQLTVSPEEAPEKPTYIELGFEKGIPASLDGVPCGPVELLERLNATGGANAIGRVDLVENRLVGMKSRGVYETPGGSLVMAAHRELESLTLDRETLHYKALVAQRYAELVYYGQWFTPLRESLDQFVDKTQERVTGSVRLKLYKGNVTVAGRKSPYSLYSQAFASFEQEEVYNQKDAQGFINLFGLPLTVRAVLDIEREGKSSYL